MNNRHIVAVIQARMGSTRLPAKSLLSLHDHAIIDWVVQRVKKSKLLDDIIVAIPKSYENIPLFRHIIHSKVKVFQGAENDVLDRMLKAAEHEKATHVVRVCADNPLIWGGEIDNLIEWYFENPCDYAYNHIPLGNSYPDGLGAEIVSIKILRQLAKEAQSKEHREHCLSYIMDNKEKFTVGTFDPKNKELRRPEIKLDIDTLDDYLTLENMDIDITMTPEEIIALF